MLVSARRAFVVACLLMACAAVRVGYAWIDVSTAVGLWSFDEGKGNDTADVSGNENDGTLAGGADWMEGKFGSALQFSEVGDWVDCGNEDSLEPHTDSFSFGFWMKQEDPTNARILWKNNGAAPPFVGYFLGLQDGKVYQGFGDGVKWAPQAGLDGVTVGSWVHLFAVRDVEAKRVRVYVNGEKKQDTDDPTQDIVFPGTNLIIGSRPGVPHEQFFGVVDEVAIFRSVLGDADVKSLMARGVAEAGLAVSPTGRLVSAWASLKAGASR